MAEDLGSMIADTGQRRTHRWRVRTYLDGWSEVIDERIIEAHHVADSDSGVVFEEHDNLCVAVISRRVLVDIHRIDDESEEA